MSSSVARAFIAAGSDAITAARLLNTVGALYVSDYGAIGDGVTDDTAAINAALTAASQSNQYCAVFFPPAEYRITAELISTTRYVAMVGIGPYATVIRQDTYGLSCIQLRANYNQVIGIGFKSANSVQLTGTYAAGTGVVMTLPVSAASLGITTSIPLCIDKMDLFEAVLPTAVSGNTITVNTAYTHDGSTTPFQITVCAVINGTRDGVSARNLAAGVYIANASNCVVSDCASWGMIEAVSLRGSTTGNQYNNTGNRVRRVDCYGYDFGILCQQNTDIIIEHIYGLVSKQSQGSNPPHLIYMTGQNPNATFTNQHNENVIISNCMARVNATAAGYALKFCKGITVTGLKAETCVRGIDLEGCTDATLTNITVVDMPNYSATDSVQAGIVIQDCHRVNLSNSTVSLLSYSTAIITTDSTDSYTAGAGQVFTVNDSLAALTAGGCADIDIGSANERVIVSATNNSNTFTATTAQAHTGTTTPFKIVFYPPTDGMAGITCRSGNSQNANGQTCTDVIISSCRVETGYTSANSTNVFRAEGQRIKWVDCEVYQTGDTASGGGWYCFSVAPGGTTVSATSNGTTTQINATNTQGLANGTMLTPLTGTAANVRKPTYVTGVVTNTSLTVAPALPASTTSGDTFITGQTPDSVQLINPTVTGTFGIVQIQAQSTNCVIELNTDILYTGMNANSISNSTTGTQTHISIKDAIYANFASSSFPRLTANNATPSVTGHTFVETNNTIQTTYTGLNNAIDGQRVTILCYDGGSATAGQYTIILPSASFVLNDAWYPASGDLLELRYDRTSWREIGRSGGWGWTAVTGATPAVSGYYSRIKHNNGGATTVTNFTGGHDGQMLIMASANGNTTIQHDGTHIALTGATNYVLSATKTLTLILTGGIWVETGRGGA